MSAGNNTDPPGEQARHLLKQMSTLPRLIGRFVGNSIVGQPWVVNIEVTLRCNARCDFCNYWRQGKQVELEDYAPVVRRFHPFIVNLTGGEPLLRRDLLQLIQRIKATGPVYLSLLTNGALLSGEKASKLRQAGLDGLSISLNYPGPEHDQERNIPGLFEHIREVIPQVKRAGFRRIDLNTVIMATNLGRLDELARLARSWGVGLCFSSYSAGKTGSDERGDLDLEQLDETIQRMRRLKREGWPIECSDFYMEQVPRYFREGGVPNCRAGQRTIHVTPDGMVKPCPDLPPVAHFSRYETRNQPPVTCTSCWYRCRGESEVPITPSWLLYVAGQYLKRTDRDTNGGR